MRIRTDLAIEGKELYEKSAAVQTQISGVEASEYEKQGIMVSHVRVLDRNGEEAIGKPAGNYVTLTLGSPGKIDETELRAAADVLEEELRDMLNINDDDGVLIAGLGNEAITPDAVGPLSIKNIFVTRHLKSGLPEMFGNCRPVAAVEPGVLASTGIESSDIIRSIAEIVRPACVIVIDALATRSLSRICCTVQIADSGITPGSGVGNSRKALNRETLGIPVIAVGVPTVVDVGTLCADIMERAGLGEQDAQKLLSSGGGMIVTPRDIDEKVSTMSRLVGMGINLAIHDGFDIEDFDWMVQ